MSDYWIVAGDCRQELLRCPADSIDACVTDPPYELAFMGKKWDATGVAFDMATWKAVLRVLKPGGHLLAFGGTRTHHRMVCAIEDAGFEIRDELQWLYGSGFPKSLDVSKAIDKAAGAEREVVGRYQPPGMEKPWNLSKAADERTVEVFASSRNNLDVTAPATDAARQWDGWGTALKPACEPIVLARKPLAGTVAANVLEHGTGALNIDGCRIEAPGEVIQNHSRSAEAAVSKGKYGDSSAQTTHQTAGQSLGRWPANVILDEEAGALLDAQSGTLTSGAGTVRRKEGVWSAGDVEHSGLGKAGDEQVFYGDSGGASRFFYCAKPSKKERNEGGAVENTHPTVKPVKLLRYLVRLVTPPGGTVLDPFAGSGTTLLACQEEGFDCIGIELDPAHVEIAERRLKRLG